ncbi:MULTISPECIES: adenylate/guanylate cyclase domain-containing protein [unclassified Mesorhizobium]|uniref:adenylate/guanylate cyclase domain-containing protein n=1 Tax=unclassified Mesorhizobium TaxID=325217 RepID=UPI0033363C33
MSENRKLAAILAADVVGYSRLASADEDRTLARLRALRSDLIDPIIAVHHGRVIKRTGDGALVEFRSVVDAVRCAVEIQNGMVERNAGVPQERRIEFRIGIHLGDVVEESDGDLMGDGVNIASRLEGGEALYYSGRSAEALESFARGKTLNPYFPDVLLHFQALASCQLGRYEEAVDLLLQRLARNAVTDVSRALLAACYGHLGRLEEAHAAWQDLLRVNPAYSLEHRRKVLPYKNPADFELMVEGLRKAGLVQ